MLCGSSVVFLVGWFSLQTVTVYYARDVLGNADYYIVLTVVQTAGVFAAALLVPRLVARIGKKRVYQALGAIAALSGIAVALRARVGPCDRDRGVRLLRHRPRRRQHGRRSRCRPTRSSTASGRPDRARRARRTRSSRSRGKSARRSARRPRPTPSASAGTSSGAASQPDSAVTAIKTAAGLVPAAFILAAIAIMSAYPLTEAAFREIVREVAAASRRPRGGALREHAGRAGDRRGRLPRGGAGVVAAVGRPALGGHARRRRALAGDRRLGRAPARRRGRSRAATAARRRRGHRHRAGIRARGPRRSRPAARRGLERPVGAHERGRLRPRRALLLRLDGLRPARGSGLAVPPRPRRQRARRASRASPSPTASSGARTGRWPTTTTRRPTRSPSTPTTARRASPTVACSRRSSTGPTG